MRLLPKLGIVALAGLVALAGCKPRPKLNDERTLELAPGTIKPLEVPAVDFEQTVHVSFNADAPVSVYLVLAKDVPQDAHDAKIVAGAKAKAEKQTSGSISATVPANEQMNLYLVTDRQAATVTVKITN